MVAGNFMHDCCLLQRHFGPDFAWPLLDRAGKIFTLAAGGGKGGARGRMAKKSLAARRPGMPPRALKRLYKTL
jgi:hypothetical protein